MRRLLILMLSLGILALGNRSWAEQVALSPPASRVELRIYGLGLLPFDGSFARFHGSMRYDPSNPSLCQVILEIEPASLVMNSDSVRDQIVGPDSMDVERFPALSFHGICSGDTVGGDLTLHGQTHPFSLDLERSPSSILATGHLRRADWGLTSHPLTGGSTIRIRVEIPNPVHGPHT